MSRIVHFEIPADDTARARKFYGDVFGWKFQTWEGPMEYHLASTGPADQRGIDGAIYPRPQPGAGVVNTIGVGSLDDTIRKIEAAGGRIVVPKMEIPGVGWLAQFTDPEGNVHGVLEPTGGAK